LVGFSNGVRKPDHLATGQELNSIKSDGPDFGWWM
jgi:hypothetical protein